MTDRVYYQADTQCPLYPDLRRVMLKTAGLADVLRQALEPFQDRIPLAFVYGSIARGEERAQSDVDLMVVGRATLFELTGALREAEKRLGRPLNTTLYNPAESAKKLASDNR